MGKKRIVVIGGSAARPKAAAKARRLDEDAEVVLLQKGADLSMASCGYPYYVGGTFDDRNQLLCTPAGVVRDPKFYLNAKAIDARINTEATGIDRQAHTVSFRNLITGEASTIGYDKLILATGAIPKIPPIPGITIGTTGGIDVDEYTRSSDKDIYAIGDYVEIKNRLTGKKVLAPYAGTSQTSRDGWSTRTRALTSRDS